LVPFVAISVDNRQQTLEFIEENSPIPDLGTYPGSWYFSSRILVLFVPNLVTFHPGSLYPNSCNYLFSNVFLQRKILKTYKI